MRKKLWPDWVECALLLLIVGLIVICWNAPAVEKMHAVMHKKAMGF